MLNVLFLDEVSLEGMREYQLEGIDWLLENDIAVLADDMGLEKLFRLLRQWTINSEKELSQIV